VREPPIPRVPSPRVCARIAPRASSLDGLARPASAADVRACVRARARACASVGFRARVCTPLDGAESSSRVRYAWAIERCTRACARMCAPCLRVSGYTCACVCVCTCACVCVGWGHVCGWSLIVDVIHRTESDQPTGVSDTLSLSVSLFRSLPCPPRAPLHPFSLPPPPEFDPSSRTSRLSSGSSRPCSPRNNVQ